MLDFHSGSTMIKDEPISKTSIGAQSEGDRAESGPKRRSISGDDAEGDSGIRLQSPARAQQDPEETVVSDGDAASSCQALSSDCGSETQRTYATGEGVSQVDGRRAQVHKSVSASVLHDTETLNPSGRRRSSRPVSSVSSKTSSLPESQLPRSYSMNDARSVEEPLHVSTKSTAPPKVIVTSAPISLPMKGNGRQKGTLRRGKWTVEEEAYVARVIQDFNSGFLHAPAGTTLRTYLSEKLQCDPMRITKKFTGDACIGKRVFHPVVRSSSNAEAIDKAQIELHALEMRWRRRLESQQRESARKAAASAAAARSSSSYDSFATEKRHNAVTQTASWLDRAKSALKADLPSEADLGQSTAIIQNQMNEVQRLIKEGPVIQTNSDGITNVMERGSDQHPSPSGSDTEPEDKRLRTAADAEALVGFIRSVRESAASGSTL